jgi:hypothetical protein
VFCSKAGNISNVDINNSKGFRTMKNLLLGIVVALVVGSFGFSDRAAYGQYYGEPVVVQSFYGPTVVPSYTPAYTPAYAPAYVYPVAPSRRIVYSPVLAAPVVAPAPVYVPAPVVVSAPVVIGPTGKIYIPGRPVRNVVRVIVP